MEMYPYGVWGGGGIMVKAYPSKAKKTWLLGSNRRSHTSLMLRGYRQEVFHLFHVPVKGRNRIWHLCLFPGCPVWYWGRRGACMLGLGVLGTRSMALNSTDVQPCTYCLWGTANMQPTDLTLRL